MYLAGRPDRMISRSGKGPRPNQKEKTMPWTLKHGEDPDTGDFANKTKFDSLKDLIEFGLIEVTKDDFGNIGGAISIPAFSDWFPHSVTPRPTLKAIIGAKPDGFTAEEWAIEAKMAFNDMKNY
jgi:hypothetical protein